MSMKKKQFDYLTLFFSIIALIISIISLIQSQRSIIAAELDAKTNRYSAKQISRPDLKLDLSCSIESFSMVKNSIALSIKNEGDMMVRVDSIKVLTPGLQLRCVYSNQPPISVSPETSQLYWLDISKEWVSSLKNDVTSSESDNEKCRSIFNDIYLVLLASDEFGFRYRLFFQYDEVNLKFVATVSDLPDNATNRRVLKQ